MQARGAKFGQGSHQLKFEVKGKGTSHVHSARRTLCWPGFNLSRPTPGFNLSCPMTDALLQSLLPNARLRSLSPDARLQSLSPDAQLQSLLPNARSRVPFRALRHTASEGEEREVDPFFQDIFVLLVFYEKNQNFYHFLNLLWVFYPFPN